MPTITLRQNHDTNSQWSDLTVSIPDAANISGFVKHLGGASAEVVFGGDQPPPVNIRGVILPSGGEEWGEASHIWVRCRARSVATLGFQVVE